MKKFLTLLICTLACVALAKNLVAYRTYFVRGYYVPPGSLDEHLWANWEARTNGRDARLLSTIGHVSLYQATNAVWNTNWFFYGTENFTAQSQLSSNAPADVGLWRWKKCALLSRVLIVNMGHNMCNTSTNGTCGTNLWLMFLDATNGQHWRRPVYGISRNEAGVGDYYVAALNAPLPTNVATMPLVLKSTWTNKLEYTDQSVRAPSFFSSQFSRTEANTGATIPGNFITANTTNPYAQQIYSFQDITFTGGTGLPITVYYTNQNRIATNETTTAAFGSRWGADSGSPTYLVISNRLCFFAGSGIQAASFPDEAQFFRDVNTVTTNAGFTTNAYPLVIEPLNQFPDL